MVMMTMLPVMPTNGVVQLGQLNPCVINDVRCDDVDLSLLWPIMAKLFVLLPLHASTDRLSVARSVTVLTLPPLDIDMVY